MVGRRMKSKGYAKGGAKMMKAMGGKMAKGYAKGGAKMMKAKGGNLAKKKNTGMTLAQVKAAAKKLGKRVV